jgi:integrase
MAKKRSNGEGTVYYDSANDLWYGAVSINGKRRKTRGYPTQREALAALRQLQRDRDVGVDITAPQKTVRQFLEEWLREVVKPNTAPKTYHSYRQMVQLYLIPQLGKYQLNSLRPAHVQTMLNDLSQHGKTDGQGLAPRTVQYIRTVLVQALNLAIEWEWLARNVAALTKSPRVPKIEIKPLDRAQARALLAAVAGHRLATLYRVALSLGLRKGEVIGLRWTDVNWEAKTLLISGQIQRVGGKLERRVPKTEHSLRTIPLPDALITALRCHQRAQEEERALMGEKWKEHGLVFPSEVGTPIEPRNLSRHFKSVLKKVGLPQTTRFHDLRHSCATMMLAQGIPLQDVSAVLGHSSISIAADIYDHPDDARTRAATSAADHAMQPEDEQNDE